MASYIGLRGLASLSLCIRPTAAGTTRLPLRPATPAPLRPAATATPFSTSMPLAKLKKSVGPKKKKEPKAKGLASTRPSAKKRGPPPRDPKIPNILRQLALMRARAIPAPLRMARNRHLRHWTIHRAWLLYRRQRREARETALMQLQNSMSKACETLRTTAGPGSRPEGYLYRVAAEKKGVWGPQGIPIEYARPLTETPAREAWNHNWKR